MEELLGFPARERRGRGRGRLHRRRSSLGRRRRAALEAGLTALRPGVTELLLRPAVDSPELRAIATDWPDRVDDHRLVCEDGFLRRAVEAAGATLVGFRALRNLARS